MAARVGTAYIEVQPDLRHFNRDLARQMRRSRGRNIKVGVDVDTRDLSRKLRRVRGHNLKVGTDVDTRGLRRYEQALKRTEGSARRLGRSTSNAVGGQRQTVALQRQSHAWTALGASMGAVGRTARFATLGVAGLGAVVGGKAIRDGLKFNATMESNELAFRRFVGGSKQAKKFLNDLFETAKKTPFEMTDLTNASRRLLAFGLNAEKTKRILNATGDAIAAMGGGAENIDRVTLALGQMQAKGKVSAEELLQLTEAGIPAYQILKEELHLTGKQISNIGNEGISSGKAIDALTRGMERKFGGAAREQSKTWDGMFSTMKDNWAQTTGAMTQGLFRQMKRWAPAVNATMGDLTAIWKRKDLDFGEKFKLSTASVRKNLGPVARQIGDMLKRANIPQKLGDAIRVGLPKLANALASGIAKFGPKIAKGFWDAFKNMGTGGKLLTGAFILSRFMGGGRGFSGAGKAASGNFRQSFQSGFAGGFASFFGAKFAEKYGDRIPVFRRLANNAGDQMGTGIVATSGRTMEKGIRGRAFKGRLMGAFRSIGPALGLTLAAYLVPELASQLKKQLNATKGRFKLPASRPGVGGTIGRGLDHLTKDEPGSIETNVARGLNKVGLPVLAAGMGLQQGLGKSETAMRKFGDSAERHFKRFRVAGNTAGLVRLRHQALDFARTADGPGKRSLINFANAMLPPIRQSRRVNAAIKGMRDTSFTNIRALSRGAVSNFRLINRTMGDNTKEGRRATERNFKAIATSVARNIKDGTISVRDGGRLMQRLLGRHSKGGRDATVKNFQSAAAGIQRQMDRGVISTREGSRLIHALMNQALTQLGAAKAPPFKLTGGQLRRLGNARGGVVVQKKAKGGLVQFGRQGGAGRDNIPLNMGGTDIEVGSGEQGAVLTRHHQQDMTAMVRERGYRDLPDYFDKNNRKHYMARGGLVPRRGYAAGGMVPVPGEPGTTIHPSILRDVVALKRRYKLDIRDGYAATGHAAGGDHPKGMGFDAIPGAGGSWGLIDKLARWAEPSQNNVRPPFRWIGYWGDYNHGPGNHIHVGFKPGQHLRGIPGVASSRIPRIVVQGEGGPARMSQAALDKERAAANRKIARAEESQLGGTGGETGVNMRGLGRGNAANRRLGKRIAKTYGWGTGPHWAALDHLWGVDEGHWDENLGNYAGSGAYGIAQALPASKYPPAGRPGAPAGIRKAEAQIRWGLNYIKGGGPTGRSFHTPMQADAFRHRKGWYSMGGLLGTSRRPAPPPQRGASIARRGSWRRNAGRLWRGMLKVQRFPNTKGMPRVTQGGVPPNSGDTLPVRGWRDHVRLSGDITRDLARGEHSSMNVTMHELFHALQKPGPARNENATQALVRRFGERSARAGGMRFRYTNTSPYGDGGFSSKQLRRRLEPGRRRSGERRPETGSGARVEGSRGGWRGNARKLWGGMLDVFKFSGKKGMPRITVGGVPANSGDTLPVKGWKDHIRIAPDIANDLSRGVDSAENLTMHEMFHALMKPGPARSERATQAMVRRFGTRAAKAAGIGFKYRNTSPYSDGGYSSKQLARMIEPGRKLTARERRRRRRRRGPARPRGPWGVPKRITDGMTRNRTGAETFAEYGERASSLSADGSPAKVNGAVEATWLARRLDALFKLRNFLIRGRESIDGRRGLSKRELPKANKRLKNLDAAIRKLNRKRRKTPRQKARLKRWKLSRDKIKKVVIPGLSTGHLDESYGTWTEELKEVQGTASMRALAKMPPLGTLGGSIFDTQIRLRELGKSTTTASDSSEKADLLAESLKNERLRRIVSERMYDIFRTTPPFGGVFHQGGVVPGPRGSERMILARSGEEVLTEGERGGRIEVVIRDQRTHVFVDGQEQRATVRDETRTMARRRPLPGQAGVLK